MRILLVLRRSLRCSRRREAMGVEHWTSRRRRRDRRLRLGWAAPQAKASWWLECHWLPARVGRPRRAQ
eukprot:6175844-Pleurochrysis_carterae.AAC.3